MGHQSSFRSAGGAQAPPPSSGSGSGAPVRPKVEGGWAILGRRHHFLVDPKSQVPAVAMVGGLTLALLVALNVSLFLARGAASTRIAEEVPELSRLLFAQDRFEIWLVLLASVMMLVGVVLVTIFETHKTAGAAYNLSQMLEQVRDGNYSIRLAFRKNDKLRGVEHSFNEMAQALQQRAEAEQEVLGRLSNELAKLQPSQELSASVEDLHRIVLFDPSGDTD